MKVLSILFLVLAAGPVNDRLVVQKSCQITCSGEADNFSQYNNSNQILRLEGSYDFLEFHLDWCYIESKEKIK